MLVLGEGLLNQLESAGRAHHHHHRTWEIIGPSAQPSTIISRFRKEASPHTAHAHVRVVGWGIAVSGITVSGITVSGITVSVASTSF